MNSKIGIIELGNDDFARRFSMRAVNLMWLLGAGSSASAGIPTASDMIWELKQQLYVSQKRISPSAVSDLSNPVVRARLQAHVDALGQLPPPDTPEEYAALFEAVYPAEADRRTYIDAKMKGAKASYGHLVLATLMCARLTRLVWTTNFDPLIADACAKVHDGTGLLTTVALDSPDLAAQAIGEQRWPVEVKLHGDFRSRRLKNTSDELRQQDSRLRQMFIESCRRFGLVVAGYSGRDDSIMDALNETVDREGAFPAGLFWLHRGDGPPLPRVLQFLTRAAEGGVEVSLVSIQSFDEALRDLVRLISGLDTKVIDAFAAERQRWSSAPRPAGKCGWPEIRLNALPVVQSPTVCRRVVCDIGGYAEVRQAVVDAGRKVLVARSSSGVLAYGADGDVRAAFDAHGITDFDLHTIETRRLRYDSAERGLLREALTCAISRERHLDVIRRRTADLLAPVDPRDERWTPLKRIVDSLKGAVNGHPELTWREGVAIRLEWADDRLWLLFEPRCVFDGINEDNKAAATDFARERTVKRYNRILNDLIGFWAELLGGDSGDLRALGVGDGVDATFRLSPETAFSRRVGA